jgi:hypothetical protein
MKSLLNIFFAFLLCLLCVGTSQAQTAKADKKAQKAADLKRIIDGKNFIFKANMAMPQGGANIQLTSSYDLKLANDTLVAFLPYYGVAYSAPYNPTEGGIKFTSTKFDYAVTQKKNGNFEISIKPLDLQPRAPSDVQKIFLTISAGGWANLQIINFNRQSISFSGTVEEVKPKPAS